MIRLLGVILMLTAIALVAVPRFTDCESQGKAIEVSNGGTVPMKCHWTGIAEIGVALPMYMIGALMTTIRRRSILSMLSIFGVVLGGLALAFPTQLIGVCPSPTMICSTLMKPALVLLGAGAIGSSGLALGLSQPWIRLPRSSLLFFVSLSKRVVAWKGA